MFAPGSRIGHTRSARGAVPPDPGSLGVGSLVAYLIITSDELFPRFSPAAHWKTAQRRARCPTGTLSFIREPIPRRSGRTERIRMFIRDAYGRWGTRWVLLVATPS